MRWIPFKSCLRLFHSYCLLCCCVSIPTTGTPHCTFTGFVLTRRVSVLKISCFQCSLVVVIISVGCRWFVAEIQREKIGFTVKKFSSAQLETKLWAVHRCECHSRSSQALSTKPNKAAEKLRLKEALFLQGPVTKQFESWEVRAWATVTSQKEM